MNERQLDEQLAAFKHSVQNTKTQWANYRDAELDAFRELREWASDMRALFCQYRHLPKEVQDLVDLESEGGL